MVDITIPTGVERPGILHSIGHALGEMFARHRWQRFQLKAAILSDRQLAEIGTSRAAIMSASTAEEFMSQN